MTMNTEPEVGKWYFASYGFETVLGRCQFVYDEGVSLSFRWGNPFRTNQFLDRSDLLCEGPDPRWFGLFALFALWRAKK